MRVLVIDDHPIIQDILRLILDSAFKDCCVEIAADLKTAADLASHDPPPDLVLLELGLPGYADVRALLQFRSLFPQPAVVVVSAKQDPKIVRRALQAGAAGYIPKTMPSRMIAPALRLVVAGAIYAPAELLVGPPPVGAASRVSRDDSERQGLELTERQWHVLQLMMDGCKNREISDRLSIALGTVKQHLHAIFDKLGASTRSEAMVSALRRGVRPTTPEPARPLYQKDGGLFR